MKFYVLLSYLLITFMISCDNQSNKDDKITSISVGLENKSVRLSHIFSDIEVIPLKTLDTVLVEPEAKIDFTDNLVFVESDKSILIFNYKGELIQKIKHCGIGRGEYSSISDFFVDDNLQVIEVLDKNQKKILQYDYNNKYLSEIPLNFWAIKFIRNDNNLFVYNGNERDENNKYKFRVLAPTHNATFAEIDKNKSKYLHIFNLINFYKRKNELLFFEPFNDTIYTLQPNKLEPKYAISYNEGNIPTNFYEKHDFENVFDFFQEIKTHNYVNGTYNVFETENKLFFQCYYKGKKYLVEYDKLTHHSISYDSIIDDVFLPTPTVLPFQDNDFIFFAQNDKVLFTVPTQWLLDSKQNVKEPFSNLKIDDNPLLFIAKIK